MIDLSLLQDFLVEAGEHLVQGAERLALEADTLGSRRQHDRRVDHLDDDVAQVAQFHLSSGESFEFLIHSVRDLARAIIAEARDELGMRVESS